MSTPISAWWRTTSATDSRRMSSSSASSTSPAERRRFISIRPSGRERLPTWVVRILDCALICVSLPRLGWSAARDGAGVREPAIPWLAPRLPCHVRDEAQLAQLRVPLDRIPLGPRGEAALRRDRELVAREDLAGLVDPTQQVGGRLEQVRLGGHEPEYEHLVV